MSIENVMKTETRLRKAMKSVTAMKTPMMGRRSEKSCFVSALACAFASGRSTLN